MNAELEGKNGKVKVMYVRDNDKKGKERSHHNGKGHRKDSGDRRVHRSDGRFHRSSTSMHQKKSERKADISEHRSPWADALSRLGWPIDEGETQQKAEKNEHVEVENEKEVDPELLQRQRREETRVYGENACHALFKKRPDIIIRAWFLQSVTSRFRDCLRTLAENRKAYHVVDESELEKVAGTKHHGGVCFLIKKGTGIGVNEWLATSPKRDCVLALENVGNPYNIGGIMRSCAHFGIRGILVEEASLIESGAAVRTAEGGAEWVQAINAKNLKDALMRFRQSGYSIVTTSSHKGVSLVDTSLPEKMVLVLGHEGEGLSDAIWRQGDIQVAIAGTGCIDSLNVSVATGVFLAEWWRQHGAALS